MIVAAILALRGYLPVGLVCCFVGQTDKPYFAQDMKGMGMAAQEMPEWKKASFGGNKASYGKRTNLTILEQRQSLPIYKLRDELVKVGNLKLCCWKTVIRVQNNCQLRR